MPRSFLVKKHFSASKKPNYSELESQTGACRAEPSRLAGGGCPPSLPPTAERCAPFPCGCGIFSLFRSYREERPAGWAGERSGCVVPQGRQRPLG